MDVVVNDASSLPMVRGTTGLLSRVRIPFRVGTLSTRHAPTRMRGFTGRTTKHNVGMVVTTTKVTTTLPKMVTTGAALPIVKIPMGNSMLSNMSTLCSVVRVPPKVPITAMTVGNTVGTTVLTMRVLTLDSTRLTRGFTTCGRNLGGGVMGTGRRLGRIGCTCGAGWLGRLLRLFSPANRQNVYEHRSCK